MFAESPDIFLFDFVLDESDGEGCGIFAHELSVGRVVVHQNCQCPKALVFDSDDRVVEVEADRVEEGVEYR